MNPEEVLFQLKQIGREKSKLTLPEDGLRALDAYLSDVWGIRLSSWQAFKDDLALAVDEGTVRRWNELHELRLTTIMTGREVPGTDPAFYDFISQKPLFGLVHSLKRVLILDTAAYLSCLAKLLHLNGPILDIGCHGGYHAIWLSRFVQGSVTGIDSSRRAIEFAQSMAGELGSTAQFLRQKFPRDCRLTGFSLAYTVDSIHDWRWLRPIASTLAEGGIYVCAEGLLDMDPRSIDRQARKAGLGFAFADVVGGWTGDEFESSRILVFVKGAYGPVPRDLEQQITEMWDGFRIYANTPGVDWAEKTHAFYRTKLATGTAE